MDRKLQMVETHASDPFLSADDLARRDAVAMVQLLNNIHSGMEPFEHIYESLKSFHGEHFEKHFREEMEAAR